MKSIMFMLAFSLGQYAISANASECEVYGISDSPQKLFCSFGKMDVNLSCRETTYYLNNNEVQVAFHMEVESGPVPLVFKTNTEELTILIKNKNIKAELSLDGKNYHGRCRP